MSKISYHNEKSNSLTQEDLRKLDVGFYISEFSNKMDNQPKKVKITWDKFTAQLQKPVIRPNKDGKLFSPATFNGTRSKEHAQEISLLVLDSDDGTTLEEIITKCKTLNYNFFIYTTHSHTEEKHKFRVVFLLATPIPANIYPLLWKWTAKEFPTIDLSAKDCSRMFYYPAIKTPESPFYAESFDGNLLDWRELPLVALAEESPKQENPKPSSKNPTQNSNKAKSAYVQAALDDELSKIKSAVKGERNSTVNKAAFSLAQLLHTNLIDETTIKSELEQSALSVGLTRDEARRTIESALAAGRKHPRIIPENEFSNSYQQSNNKHKPTPTTPPRDEQKKDLPKFEIKSLKSLLEKNFPDVSYLIPGILPEQGVNLVVGKPKTGKSSFVTNLALALAYQGIFLNQKVEKAHVLYLNLEDGERRLRQRIAAILAENEHPPENFDYVEGITGIDAIAAINQWLAQQQGKTLVVVDTLAKFRGMMKHNQNLYEFDYQSLQLLRELALKYQATFLVIHHSRKAESEDAIDLVSGSLGLSGAADNVFVLKRARGMADAELHTIGRDLEDQQLALRYSYPHWTLLGNAQEYAVSRERHAIINILKEHGPLKVGQIHEFLKADRPTISYNSVKQFVYKMKTANQIKEIDKGKYCLLSEQGNTETA